MEILGRTKKRRLEYALKDKNRILKEARQLALLCKNRKRQFKKKNRNATATSC